MPATVETLEIPSCEYWIVSFQNLDSVQAAGWSVGLSVKTISGNSELSDDNSNSNWKIKLFQRKFEIVEAAING
jgi:hypothetical protein